MRRIPRLARSTAYVAAAAWLAAVWVGRPAELGAQVVDELRWAPPTPQVELRAEAVVAEQPGAVVGAGVNVRAGWYVRAGALLAAGTTWPESGRALGLARLDATLRFHLDPFADRPRGLYAGGGLSLAHRGGGDGLQDPLLLLLLGVEGAPEAGRVWAFEVDVGGGLRVGVARRSARRDGYR
jgi:hypothetical protein